MPGQRRQVLEWPYTEGLRLDEAMHPLTILAVGLYGEYLPNQNGAPIRLVVPWKYGFKSIKSIVRIRLTDREPMNSWQLSAPNEYGFYSNVNPERDHPAMVAGARTAHRRVPHAADADVQRIRRSGGVAVLRNGSEEILLKLLVFAAALVPFAHLLWRGFNGDLTADPLVEITNETGIWTLRFVVITLAITPIRRLTGWNPMIRFRRMLGLFAFFYAMLHFLTYLVGDRFASLDFPDGFVAWSTLVNLLASIWEDVAKRPYITVGFIAFVSMIPLALTSTTGWIRRLGGRNWQRLHRLDLPDGYRRRDPLLVARESRHAASADLRGHRGAFSSVTASRSRSSDRDGSVSPFKPAHEITCRQPICSWSLPRVSPTRCVSASPTFREQEVVRRIWDRDPSVWSSADEDRWLGWLTLPMQDRERRRARSSDSQTKMRAEGIDRRRPARNGRLEPRARSDARDHWPCRGLSDTCTSSTRPIPDRSSRWNARSIFAGRCFSSRRSRARPSK